MTAKFETVNGQAGKAGLVGKAAGQAEDQRGRAVSVEALVGNGLELETAPDGGDDVRDWSKAGPASEAREVYS